MRQLGGCNDGRSCPRIDEDEDVIVVQGVLVTDRAVTEATRPGAGEAVVRIPRAVFLEAARALEVP